MIISLIQRFGKIRKMLDKHFILAMILIQLVMKVSSVETCKDIGSWISGQNFHSNDLYPWDNLWYNTTFWGGFQLVAWKDDIGPHCWNSYSSHPFLVLLDKHPNVSELGATEQNLDTCLMTQTGTCDEHGHVDVMNCDGHVLYRFSDIDFLTYYISDIYICFDRIYASTCSDPALSLPAVPVNSSVSLVQVYWDKLEQGWYDSVYEGKNYTTPLIKDVNQVSEFCYGNYDRGIYRQEYLPVSEIPVGMRVCVLSGYDYDMYYGESYYGSYSYKCDNHVFVRSCNGKLQLDLTLMIQEEINSCLVRTDNVEVIPEIRHIVTKVKISGKYFNQYNPYLQYRCSFQMTDDRMYTIKWYIDGEYLTEKGPSNNTEELVLKEADLNDAKLGYTVKCSVAVHSRKRSASYSFESSSEEYFAGFKVTNRAIGLSKIGQAFVSVEATVPLGCSYNDGTPDICEESLTLNDLENTCSDGVLATNANDISTTIQTIKSLKQNEKWNGRRSYPFQLKTIDRTYDDKDNYRLKMMLNGALVTSELTDDIKVAVEEWDYTKEKMCYSHVDPHMRTANLRKYEQQRVGDYMLYRNMRHRIWVLERAQYCVSGKSVVCACAVIVRAGKEVFKINHCRGYTDEIEFIHCGKCGILDVVKINDKQYEIYTPIGTRISVTYIDWSNGRNINIDIYLMAKDYKKTDGLCGWFDNTDVNDFRLRNGKTVNGNSDYTFSEDWRLTPAENLFINSSLQLLGWNEYTPTCYRKNSITVEKCRKVKSACSSIRKRRTTEGKTLKMKTLGHKYVYQSKEGGDVTWAEAHVLALNNIATNIINLNPIFKANNSDLVETFLSHTCVHNCSNNGICTKDGLCNCTGIYKGYDCSVDIRIPPPINDVNDGGECSGDGEEECRCFIIKTENIFEEFYCDIKSFQMGFNGEKKEIGSSRSTGGYDDIYTGVCCAQFRPERKTGTFPFVYAYDISISNDGIHFGDATFVYTNEMCLDIEDKDEVKIVVLKMGYCFIDDNCVSEGFTHHQGNSDECLVCDPNKNQFTWTSADCKENDSSLSKTALIGIVIGCTAIIGALFGLICYFSCKSSKKRRAVAANTDSITAVNAVLPEIRRPGVSKPVFRGNLPNIYDPFSAKGIIISTSESDQNGPEINTSSVKNTDGRSLSAFSLKVV